MSNHYYTLVSHAGDSLYLLFRSPAQKKKRSEINHPLLRDLITGPIRGLSNPGVDCRLGYNPSGAVIIVHFSQ